MTDRKLEGRVALVTGGSSGIGRATAIGLAEEGAKVLVNYHGNEEGAAEVAERIRDAGSDAVLHRADVSDENAVRDMFECCVDALGTLDILVSNAGIQKDARLLDMELADWEAVIGINLRGQFLCAREAARRFCARDRSRATGPAGNIVFMSSVHDIIPWAGRVNYSASKGGILMLMKSVAQELGPHRIRVNAVSPGAIKTDINREEWESEERRQRMLELIPNGRIGEPEDIARAVVWLASDDSDYVHGHALYVDGGMTLYPGFRGGG